jgi:hypothetical protein
MSDLKEQIENLNKRIGVATLFVVDNELVQAQKIRANGQRHPTALARKATSVQVCFDFIENRVIKPGEYKVYMRILSPEAFVLMDDQNSGKFMHPMIKKKVDYTISKNINYQNEKLNTCITWDNQESISPGVYVVELFTDKQKLAISTFTLK